MNAFKTNSSLWQHPISSENMRWSQYEWSCFHDHKNTDLAHKHLICPPVKSIIWYGWSGNGSYWMLRNDFWGACKCTVSDYYLITPSYQISLVRGPGVQPRSERIMQTCEGRPDPHLQFLGTLVVQRLQWEVEVVVISQLSQIKVILGIDAGRHVDVKLKQLQEVALHLIPGGGKNIWAWPHMAEQDGWREGYSISDSKTLVVWEEGWWRQLKV